MTTSRRGGLSLGAGAPFDGQNSSSQPGDNRRGQLFCPRGARAGTLMSHPLLSLAIAALSSCVVALTERLGLVVPGGSPDRLATSEPGPLARAVDLTAVAVAADAGLLPAAGAQEQTDSVADRRQLQREGQEWTRTAIRWILSSTNRWWSPGNLPVVWGSTLFSRETLVLAARDGSQGAQATVGLPELTVRGRKWGAG